MNLTQISAAAVFYASVVVLLVFALPSYIGAIKQNGVVRALLAIVLLSLLIIGFETLAVKTGAPYGKFTYGSTLGRQLFGSTPWIIALVYPSIVLGNFWLAKKISSGTLSIVFTALFTTLTYVVVAPVTAKLKIWNWESGGPFFGIPLRSFAGWLVCALVAAILLSSVWGKAEVKRSVAYSLFITILFWAGANFGVNQIIPGAVGIVVACVLFILFKLEKRHQLKEEG